MNACSAVHSPSLIGPVSSQSVNATVAARLGHARAFAHEALLVRDVAPGILSPDHVERAGAIGDVQRVTQHEAALPSSPAALVRRTASSCIFAVASRPVTVQPIVRAMCRAGPPSALHTSSTVVDAVMPALRASDIRLAGAADVDFLAHQHLPQDASGAGVHLRDVSRCRRPASRVPMVSPSQCFCRGNPARPAVISQHLGSRPFASPP